MKIDQIINETSTTSGAISTVSTPLMSMQTRNSSVYGDKKVGTLFKGKKTSKPFANSVSESKQVEEAKLDEDDLILVPGQGRKFKTGFIPHSQDRTDHEVEMALSDLFQAAKNAQKVYHIVKTYSEEQGLEGWVQEKIIKANDYLNTIREYLEHKSFQQESVSPGGTIAAGMAGESIEEEFKSKQQAKLMFAAAGDKKVAKKTGVSQKVAKEFIKKSHGQSVKSLPKKVSNKS